MTAKKTNPWVLGMGKKKTTPTKPRCTCSKYITGTLLISQHWEPSGIVRDHVSSVVLEVEPSKIIFLRVISGL